MVPTSCKTFTMLSIICLLAFFTQSASFSLGVLRSSSGTVRTKMHMMADGGGILVVGLAGSAAESVVCKLLDSGASNIAALLDRRPCSPQLLEAAKAKKVQILSGEIAKDQLFDITDERSLKLSGLMQGRIVVAVNDEGDDDLRGLTKEQRKEKISTSGPIMEALLKSLQPSVQSLLFATSVEADTAQGMFGKAGGSSGSEIFRGWCKTNNKPFSLLRYGKLTGGVPGAGPLPFIGLPLQEPELHPSYLLRSVVLTTLSSNQYAASEVCTRTALGEATARAVTRAATGLEALLVSIAGNPPTEKEWDQLFSRMTSSSNVELLRIDFGAINKPQALTNWLADVWFPQALIDADAATILRGARPVRAVKIAETGAVQIKWEDLQPDLTVKAAGGLEIRLQQGSTPGLSVVRLSQGSLPGEMQLMDKLVEGVNKNVFKRQICTPVDDSVSP